MGRFKEISTEDGWRKIICLQPSHEPPKPCKYGHSSCKAGTRTHSHSFSKRSKRHLSHGSYTHQSKRHGASQNSYRQTTSFSSLFPYPKAFLLPSHIHYTANPPQLFKPPSFHSNTSHSFAQISFNMSNAPKKKLNPPTHQLPSPHTPSPQSAMTTPGRSYANVVSFTVTNNNNIHLLQAPTRYPQPIWKSYIDNNPFAFPPADTLTHTQRKDTPQALPLPPDPSHPQWRGRCYNCLALGHDQSECTRKESVCAKCWTTGHEAKVCAFVPPPKHPQFDPLTPRGNLGDDLMPKNRPKMAMVFVP